MALPEGPKIERDEGFDCRGPAALRCPPVAPELIDVIIDMLHADRAALATCALVCKSWLPASRYHLFSKVTITKRNKLAFSELLSSSRCTITSAVEHLVLHTFKGLSPSIYRLSNVTELWLHSICLCSSCMPGPPPIDLIPLLRNLESLHIEKVSGDGGDIFLLALRILHHCPRLQSLSLEDTKGHNSDEDAAPNHSLSVHEHEVPLTPRLKSLKVGDAFMLKCFVAWWKNMVPPLEILDLKFVDSNMRDSKSLLEAVGSSLQTLRLSGNQPDSIAMSYCFTFLTQLQVLSVDFSRWPNDQNRDVRFLIEALRNMSSPQLQELTIKLPFRIGAVFPIAVNTWFELDSLLDGPQFVSTLRILAIYLRLDSPAAPLLPFEEAEIRNCFSLASARGILRVG